MSASIEPHWRSIDPASVTCAAGGCAAAAVLELDHAGRPASDPWGWRCADHSRSRATFGLEIVSGDVVHVSPTDTRRVVSVEHDEHESRMLLDDDTTLHCDVGAVVTVAQYADREHRPGRRLHVSHVHFPNGVVADTCSSEIAAALLRRALHTISIWTNNADYDGGRSTASCSCGERSSPGAYWQCDEWARAHVEATS